MTVKEFGFSPMSERGLLAMSYIGFICFAGGAAQALGTPGGIMALGLMLWLNSMDRLKDFGQQK